jgi:hypothetical protein
VDPHPSAEPEGPPRERLLLGAVVLLALVSAGDYFRRFWREVVRA